jgi:hypothetical protein
MGKLGFVAGSQYKGRKLRKYISAHVIKPVIPYPSNQKPTEARFLRVDKQFRYHVSKDMKRFCAYEDSIGRVVSRLRCILDLENYKVKRLRNIHACRA